MTRASHTVRLDIGSAFDMLDFVEVVGGHMSRLVGFDDDTLRTIAWDGQRWHRVADRPGFSTASAEIDGSLDCAPEWCMAVGSEWDGSALRATAHIRTPSTPPAG